MPAMIVPLDPKEFIPCGQHVCSQHPGLLCLHFHQPKYLRSSQSALLGTLSQVSLNDKPEQVETWNIRLHKGTEEELYVAGNTVVWSRGNVVLKTFTVDSLVKQALWCQFTVNGEDLHQFNLPHLKTKDIGVIEGIAVVAEGAVHMYSVDGDDYVTALPFAVRNVWCFKYGLLFERHQSREGSKHISSQQTIMSENDLTTIFCLQHPLREFSPVIMKNQGHVRYMNRLQDTVVHCEDDFIVTCDEKHGLHSVWKAQEVCSDDINMLHSTKAHQLNQMSNACRLSISSPGMSPFRGTTYRGSPGYASNNPLGGTSSMHASGLNKTPHNRNPSLAHLSYTPHSSKAFSPSGGSMMMHSYAFSPLRHSPHLTRSPCTPLSHESLCLNNSIHESAEPLRPELCFHHMWTETLSSTREGLSVGKATRVFRTTDLCNQSYLAYHLDSLSQLRIVRYSTSNDMSQLIFGAVVSIQARDAAPLPNQSMFILLDLNGCLTLYSGQRKVVKINVTGLPMASMSMSEGLRNTVSTAATPQPVSTPAHPSRPASAMGNLDEVGMLSPVPELIYSGQDISILTGDEFAFSHRDFTSKVSSITQVVASTLILQVAGGRHYRVGVPELCSSELVRMCLKALRYTLPNDAYLTFAVKWYKVRHAPGALNGRKVEWSLFVDCLMEYLGYTGVKSYSWRPAASGESMDFDVSASPVIAAKKARQGSQSGAKKDWDYLLNSSYNKRATENCDEQSEVTDGVFAYQAGLMSHSLSKRRSIDASMVGDTSQQGNHLLMSVFSAIHLVYEEQKLCSLTWTNVELMSPLVYRLAKDLNMNNFLHFYALDNVALMQNNLKDSSEDSTRVEEELELKMPGSFSSSLTPCVFENLDRLLIEGCCSSPFPYIPEVTVRTERIFKIFDCLFNKSKFASTTAFAPLMKSTFNLSRCGEDAFLPETILERKDISPEERVLSYMVSVGINKDELMTWPHGVLLAIQPALMTCCDNPDLSLHPDALKLLGRTDFLLQLQPNAGDWKHAKLCPSTDPLRLAWTAESDTLGAGAQENDTELMEVLQSGENCAQEETNSAREPVDADDNVTRLLFPSDHRMADAHNLLQSTKPSKISLAQQAGVDDREFMEQKQFQLLQLLNRTMALSVGRGMLMFRSRVPIEAQALSIPALDLTGRDTANSTITLANSELDLTSDLFEWPYFHNAVAAALALHPDEESSCWIHLNRSVNENDVNDTSPGPATENAGALFGLGLNHHLQELQTLNVHGYLQKSHEMTTIGLLLGLACDKCGTCDLSTMRVLSVHISALLPATSTQLDIPYRVQTAAVSAVGFLYLGSAQRLVAEVMLREIDRKLSSESEECTEREAYALSAGFALGMVTLGRGDGMPELSDLNMSDKLFHFMTGKHRRSHRTMLHWSHEAYSPDHNSLGFNGHQILEGDQVNTEVTGPGATMALALMYLKTNNSAVADWFIPPNTISLLETVKPQHLLLRTLGRSLILWDEIVPSVKWVKSHVPRVISTYLRNYEWSGANQTEDSEVDENTVLQCYAAIITGACVAIGLRFAGSQEKRAYETLVHFVNFFLSLLKQPQRSLSHPLEVIGRRLFDTCLSSCLIAMCMVVAGSGNLKALQICRYLHYSIEGDINYGSQMAVHMALGFLFLGKCRYTLATNNKAIAALLLSIYPCFPAKLRDNRYHLQALRHMYVMAAEKRLLVPIDVATRRPCYAQVAVRYLATPKYPDTTVNIVAPCLIPEATFLDSVSVNDGRFWPMMINVQKQKDKLNSLLDNGMYVQLKAGCLSYMQDPKGYFSFLSYPQKHRKAGAFLLKEDLATANLPSVLQFLCSTGSSCTKSTMSHNVSLLAEIQNAEVFFVFLNLLETCCRMDTSEGAAPLAMWQIRLASSVVTHVMADDERCEATVNLMRTIDSQLDKIFDDFLGENKDSISMLFDHREAANTSQTVQSSASVLKHFACYLIYNKLYKATEAVVTSSLTSMKSSRESDGSIHATLLRLKCLKELNQSKSLLSKM